MLYIIYVHLSEPMATLSPYIDNHVCLQVVMWRLHAVPMRSVSGRLQMCVLDTCARMPRFLFQPVVEHRPQRRAGDQGWELHTPATPIEESIAPASSRIRRKDPTPPSIDQQETAP